ncbi:hypothetical protein HK099_000929 [Clydaea vesicula]|uniref:Mitochondrial carrier protein n=1 Tax=Clydaea vesicula TaxID=447962 RepID=A0AAD5TUG7_9FUNG|nr:hypothetical protein HK099_000929 [Clydaea vesicula]
MKGVVNILGTIRREEGIRALWKGLGPNLIGVVPARSIYFATYSQGKHLYSKYLNNGVESSFIHMLSAATAGASVALVTNPIWLVKTRMQLQNESAALDIIRYKNSFHCAYVVFKTEGIRALYKGFSASLVGLSESTLQFVTYEWIKKIQREKREKLFYQQNLKKNNFNNNNNNQEKKNLINPLVFIDSPNWFELFFSAAIAKLGATLITYPHEVLRTRLRQSPDSSGNIKYKGLINSTKLILREEGIAAFYGGMTAHIMRVVPNAAILFFTYEVIVHWWQRKPSS